MTAKAQATLRTEVDSTFAVSSPGDITGAELRGFLKDFIDSARWYDDTSDLLPDATGLDSSFFLDAENNWSVPGVSGFLAVIGDGSGDESTGSKTIAHYNENDYFDSNSNLFDILEYVGAQGLFNDDADLPTEVSSLDEGDAFAIFGFDGSMKYIDTAVALGTGTTNVITLADDYTITLADFRRLLKANSSEDISVTLQLQADEAVYAGFWFDVLWKGTGTPTVVCDDASIALNGGADATAAGDARNSIVRVVNIGADDWIAVEMPAATTTDVANPTLVSVSPTAGSTILPDQIIQFTFSEPVVVGTGNIIQREDSGGGFGDDETVDVTDPLGTSAGEINIVDNVLTFYPAGARTAENDYAYRIASTALDDTSGNSYAGIANDTTVYYTVAAASGGEIEVVSVTQGYIDNGGSTQAKSFPTPSNGDMVIATTSCVATIAGGIPAGMTAIDDNTANTNPGCFAAYRIEGGSPSNSVSFNQHSSRRQAYAILVIRGTGGTLSVGSGAGYDNGIGTEAANCASLAQTADDVLRLAFHWVDTIDITPTTTALEGAGWTGGSEATPIVQNTQQGSSSVGATLVVAVLPMGGANTDSVDPPAAGTGNVVFRTFHVEIKET